MSVSYFILRGVSFVEKNGEAPAVFGPSDPKLLEELRAAVSKRMVTYGTRLADIGRTNVCCFCGDTLINRGGDCQLCRIAGFKVRASQSNSEKGKAA